MCACFTRVYRQAYYYYVRSTLFEVLHFLCSSVRIFHECVRECLLRARASVRPSCVHLCLSYIHAQRARALGPLYIKWHECEARARISIQRGSLRTASYFSIDDDTSIQPKLLLLAAVAVEKRRWRCACDDVLCALRGAYRPKVGCHRLYYTCTINTNARTKAICVYWVGVCSTRVRCVY